MPQPSIPMVNAALTDSTTPYESGAWGWTLL